MYKQLNVLLDNFDGGVLIENNEGKISFVNQKLCETFSIPLKPEQLFGFDCSEAAIGAAPLFHDPESFILRTKTIIENKKPVYGDRLFLKDNQGILERDFIPIYEDNSQVWIYRDITKYLTIENSLKYRLAFEEKILNISYDFIAAKNDDLDKVIDKALKDIGQFIQVDRTYVFQFDKKQEFMFNTYEWCNDGITPEKENLQNIPTSILPWWMEKLNRLENIVLNTLDDLNEKAPEAKEILEAQNIKSLLVVPLIYGFDILGFAGFDAVCQYRTWEEDSIKMLRMFGNILSGALKRKEDEEKIKKSEALYKSVVNNVTEVIFQVDNDGKWVFLNPAWEKITGFSIEESLGKFFSEFVHPEDEKENLNNFTELLNKQKDYCRQQVRYIKKDGSFCWMDVFARLTIEDGKITGTSGTINDITLKRIQEDEIRKFRKAIEATPNSVVLADLDGRINFVNKGLLKTGNYNNVHDIIGKSIFEFTDDRGKAKVIEGLSEIYKNNSWTGEVDVFKSDGSLIPTNMMGSLIRNKKGEPEYLTATFFDISDLKKAQEEIQNALIKEKELNEMKTRFVSLVSHEFRTPLAAILSSTEILELYFNKLSDENKKNHYDKIKTSINNLLEILDEISEINRIDAGKLNKKQINFNNFINDLIDEINITYNKPKSEIILCNKNPELEFDSDVKLLRQVATNLITNAIKFTPIEKKIYINISLVENYLMFEVKDEGIGVPINEQSSIFEPFSRSKKVVNIKGSGLGLSIVKKALELLNGSISFTSVEGEGSTFSIIIPIKEK